MGLLGQYLPDWLPDDPTKNDAARQGLLSFGAAMLGGRGNFGQILGGGLAAGSGGYQAALQNSSLAAIRDAQLQGLKLQNQGVQGAMDQQKGILALLNGSGPPASAPTAPPAASQLAGASPSAVAPLSALPQMSSAGAPPDSNMSAAALLPQAPDQSNPDASGNDLSSQPQASAPAQFVTPPVAAPASSQIASLPQVGAAQNNALSAYQSAMAQAQMIQRAYGAGAAKPYFDAAKSMKPDAKEIKTVTLPDGSRVLAQFYSDGSPPQIVQGLSPDKEKLVFQDSGSAINGLDPFTGKPMMTPMAKSVTPGEQLQSNDQAKTRAQAQAHWQAEQNAAPDDAPMDPLAVRMTAQQYLAGDSGALQNFGRGKQGAANLNAVRLEVAKQANAAGMNGADIAAKMAEFAGMKAGQRTAGIRSASIEIAANEVAQLAPIALEASSKVARSGFLPFGKAQIMFDSNSNDPNMRQFAMANTALVNAYGQAMARGGAATVSDKDHARELLSTTFDQKSYAAAVEQLQRETRAAQAAPKQVRKDLSDAVAGREVTPVPVAKLPQKSAHPADITDLLNKYGVK